MKFVNVFIIIITSFFLVTSSSFNGKHFSIKIIASGDINLVTKRPDYLKKFNLPNDYYFRNIKHILKRGDINFCNFEQTVNDSNRKVYPYPGKAYVFNGPGSHLDIVKNVGFNVFNIGNNHILDYQTRGLYETIKALKKRNIKYFGAGLNEKQASKALIVNVRGIRIAFLGYIMKFYPDFHSRKYKAGCPAYMTYKSKRYYRGINKVDSSTKFYFKRDIEKIRDKCDLIVVSIHFGKEYMPYPSEYQKITAKKAIDAGASLVLGHHPHVIQKFERYKHGVIFYSLGNLIFPSYFIDPYTMIAEITLTHHGIKKIKLHPFVFKNRHDFNLCIDDYIMFMPSIPTDNWLEGYKYMLKERGMNMIYQDGIFIEY